MNFIGESKCVGLVVYLFKVIWSSSHALRRQHLCCVWFLSIDILKPASPSLALYLHCLVCEELNGVYQSNAPLFPRSGPRSYSLSILSELFGHSVLQIDILLWRGGLWSPYHVVHYIKHSILLLVFTRFQSVICGFEWSSSLDGCCSGRSSAFQGLNPSLAI